MRSIIRLASTTAVLALAGVASAEIVTYDFGGITNVGGTPRSFTGEFSYDTSVAPDTVYIPSGNTIQGFRTSYANAVKSLKIKLSNNEQVVCNTGGEIVINNIFQQEAGAPVPKGLTMQVYPPSSAGTINGQFIHYMYLAFLPVNVSYNWDALDTLLDGNAENMLDANPSLLPHDISPTITGTQLTPDLNSMFTQGLFLGTIHSNSQGTTTTVNSINWFERRAVPTPGAAMVMGLAAFATGRRRR